MKKLKFLIAASILALASCESDDNGPTGNIPDDNFSENWGNTASRDFSGQVVDMSNNPVPGAAIKIGASSAQTDENGVFVINDAQVYEDFAYVTASKAGYFDGSRAMIPVSGNNNVKIMMIPATVVATVESGSESEVSLAGGTKVIFDGSFEDAEGNPYSGDVSVMMFQLMPSNTEIASLMPGMLYGQDENGGEAGLQTFGMMNVELRGSSGQKIRIAENHKAEIEMPIDPEQLGTAPSTIPLWHFDAQVGYWKQEGFATRAGNRYTGEVSHFSWWNCDAFSAVVQLTVTVHDGSGGPIAYAGVKLVTSQGFSSYIQYTGSGGQVSGVVPANQPMTLTLHDQCGEIVHTQIVGPFGVDANLPPIVLTDAMAQTSVVEGTLLECDGDPVTSGYILFNYGNQSTVLPVTNGDFSVSTMICTAGNAFVLEGFDLGNMQQTPAINYALVSPLTVIGSLSACDTIDEFVTYTIDGGDPVTIIGNFTVSGDLQGTANGLNISTNNTNVPFYMWGSMQVPGTYSANEFSIESGEIGYIGTQSANTMVYQLNNFGQVGEYIDMTFNGTYQWEGTTRTLSGIIHVKRDQ